MITLLVEAEVFLDEVALRVRFLQKDNVSLEDVELQNLKLLLPIFKVLGKESASVPKDNIERLVDCRCTRVKDSAKPSTYDWRPSQSWSGRRREVRPC